MTEYTAARDAEQARRLDRAIDRFDGRHRGLAQTNNRRTIILFPGGVGSQLLRAQAAHPAPPLFFSRAWLDCGVAVGETANLRMLPGGVDFQHRFIIADGCVEFAFLRPYGQFTRWCERNGIDLFVYGWDWRRGIEDAATLFLDVFMPALDARFAGRTPHPLDDFTLIGHSAGGMVVKAIANRSDNRFVRRMARAITVGTPFYGHGGQVHRLLKGDPDLNWSQGAMGASVYARIIASLPGGYEFLYLDKETYDANRIAFEADPEGFTLRAYPSRDRDTDEAADPYNPVDAGGLVRYPAHLGIDAGLLADGRGASHEVARLLDGAVVRKFFSIRGVQARDGHVLDETVVSQRWARVSSQFDPDRDPDPIQDSMGPGDGVQAAWGARLLGLPAAQVFTIVDRLEHATMMNAPAVQRRIASLLGVDPQAPVVEPEESVANMATRARLNSLIAGLRQAMADEPASDRRALIEKFLGQFGLRDLHSCFARAFVDALKTPSQKLHG